MSRKLKADRPERAKRVNLAKSLRAGEDPKRAAELEQMARGPGRRPLDQGEEFSGDSAPGRRYRVVKRLPWIEGGRPVPGGWEGGQAVVYEPGDTVYVEDWELESTYRKLEAIDDAGRAALEEARANAQAPAARVAVADLSPGAVELLTHALDEKRRADGSRVEVNFAVLRDGSEKVLWTQVYPDNPLPGVVYDDNGLPEIYATSIRQQRWESRQQRWEMERKLAAQADIERKLADKERKLAAIHQGASRGAERGRATRRDEAARQNEALLAAVVDYRKKHPSHGRPAIAEALLRPLDTQLDHADPAARRRAIAALTKRIERLEKRSLDT